MSQFAVVEPAAQSRLFIGWGRYRYGERRERTTRAACRAFGLDKGEPKQLWSVETVKVYRQGMREGMMCRVLSGETVRRDV